MHLRLPISLGLAIAALAALPLPAFAGVEYPDADWTETSIQSDGATLHGDLLRPKGAKPTDKTPVILSIGPYFNHSGQVGPAGPTQGGAAYDPVAKAPGPSERFKDFVDGSGLLKKGYSFLIVDLRGFGGSSGCLDWGGPGETADVAAAIRFAASQPWSTGAVGMYGKSYDAVTGLVGVNLRTPGLKAVVAQEPVYDLYRYLYGDGIRRLNSVATPALYDAIALSPGGLGEAASYNAGGFTDPACLATNFATQAGDDNHDSAFWKVRNLIPGAKGSDVPLFITQGMTENNTVADGLAQYLENHTGPERGWLGPWEHVRGNEKVGNRLAMGREGWFDETMRFYDKYLKGIEPKVEDPPFAIQDNTGKWRAEEQWPPADTETFTSKLKPGTYVDNGDSTGTPNELGGSAATSVTGIWTVSNQLKNDARFIGDGKVSLTVNATVPRANLTVDVYDVNKDGVGPLITRQGMMLRGTGEQKVNLTLWSADWKIAAGRRIAVRVTETNRGWYVLTVPTKQTVTVKDGSITLPFVRYKREGTIQGQPGTQLQGYLNAAVSIPAATLANAISGDFALPPAMVDRPAAPKTPAAQSPVAVAPALPRAAAKSARTTVRRLAVRLARRGRMLVATGRAPARSSLVVRLVRGKKTIATRRVRVGKRGTYRVAFRTKGAARYGVRVSGKAADGTQLSGLSRAVRLR